MSRGTADRSRPPAESSPGCAFTEGFAEWVPAAVYNDPFYRWPDGGELNLETPTWGSPGWDNGEAVEGRVASAMIDIADSENEVYYDRWSDSDPGAQWDVFQDFSVETLDQFWTGRVVNGYNTANSGANGSVYQNTIDQLFRDPLTAFAGVTRPTPQPHNYRFDTSTTDWSLVAVKPPAGSDYDLDVYDDSSQTALLKSSTFSGSLIDFVAVDFNHRALGDFYPRARVFSGAGNYQAEYVGSTGTLASGTSSISLLTGDLAAVRDLSLTVGVPVGIRVVPDQRRAGRRPGAHAGRPGERLHLGARSARGSDQRMVWRCRRERAARLQPSGQRHARLRPGQRRGVGLVHAFRRHDRTNWVRADRRRQRQDP